MSESTPTERKLAAKRDELARMERAVEEQPGAWVPAAEMDELLALREEVKTLESFVTKAARRNAAARARNAVLRSLGVRRVDRE